MIPLIIGSRLHHELQFLAQIAAHIIDDRFRPVHLLVTVHPPDT